MENEENESQGSNSGSNEKQERDIENLKTEMLVMALTSLQQKRIRRAQNNPVNEARFVAHASGPPQPYSLSDEERGRIVSRLHEQILTELYSAPPMPKFFRPPKYPERLSRMSSLKEPFRLPTKKRKIPGANRGGNSNKGIVIASTSSDKKPNIEEEDEDEDEGEHDEFKEYKAAIYKPVKSNMNELYEISEKLKEKTIQGLEGKIYALLHKGEDKVFKNYDKEPKRSFLEWVNNCKELERLNKLKVQAVNAGYALCRAILDLMFLMSENKAKEMWEKFHAFEEALGVVDRGENTVVISKVLDILLAAQIQLKRKKDLEMLPRRSKGKQVIMEKKKVPDDDDDDLKAPFPDMIMFQLVKVIFKMELFWVHGRLPCATRLLIAKFPFLELETSRFELTLMGIDEQIDNSFQEGKFGIVVEDWRETEDFINTEWKLAALWDQLD